MKKILLALGILLSVSGYSGGLLGLTTPIVSSALVSPHHFNTSPVLSLYVIETVDPLSGLYYQSWTGVKGGQYFLTEHSLMLPINKFNIGVGPSYEHSGSKQLMSINLYTEAVLW